MPSNILITGAAGYLGGSIAAEFSKPESSITHRSPIFLAVRSHEQASMLAKPGVAIIRLDLKNKDAVVKAISKYEIDVIVHAASGVETELAVNLITALGRRQETVGSSTYFIHTSGGSAFAKKGGWTHGPVSDIDGVFALEKEVAKGHPLRETDVAVTEVAKQLGVTSFIVVPPLVYGTGLGDWNRLSVSIPKYVRASLKLRNVYKFSTNVYAPAVRLSDLLDLYVRLVGGILSGKQLPSGEQGYYSAAAHSFNWWSVLEELATALYSRGLVESASVSEWPSDEVASQGLELPIPFMHMIWNSGAELLPGKSNILSWNPAWTSEDDLLNCIDGEVQAVLELDTVKSSVFDALQ